jgi:hypothetical protein
MIPRIRKNDVNPHPVAPRVDLFESFGGRWRVATGDRRQAGAVASVRVDRPAHMPHARRAEPSSLTNPAGAIHR